MCIILELILVSLHEGHLPSGWDIVVEHQCNKGPSDWENNYVPTNKQQVHAYRVVIKSRGAGIFPGYYECGRGYFYWKTEEK